MRRILILAIPKSGSTSLMKALADLTGLTAGQNFDVDLGLGPGLFQRYWKWAGSENQNTLSNAFPCTNFGLLSRMHSDVCDFRGCDVGEGLFKYEINKQHLPPTRGNKRFIEHFKVIILTRNIEDVLNSYERVPHNEHRFSLVNQLKSDKLFRADLEAELEAWKVGWDEYDADSIHRVDFEDLIGRPEVAIREILNSLDLEDVRVPIDYALPRERYYR